MNNKTLATLAVIVGVLLLIVGIMYFTQTAGSLPSFFPGHAANSKSHHYKHGIAAVVVGVCLFVFAWFQSGAKPTSEAK